MRRLLDRGTRWFLTTRGGRLDVAAEIERFRGTVRELAPLVPDMLIGAEAERMAARADEFVAMGAPPELASRVASLLDVFSLLDIAQIAQRQDADPLAVARTYFMLSEYFGVDRLLSTSPTSTALTAGTRWPGRPCAATFTARWPGSPRG